LQGVLRELIVGKGQSRRAGKGEKYRIEPAEPQVWGKAGVQDDRILEYSGAKV